MCVEQTNLEGETIGEPERIECEMYPICSDSAEFEVETLVYDGGGQVFKELPACPSCAREITEPEEPNDSDKARRLEFVETLSDTSNDSGDS